MGLLMDISELASQGWIIIYDDNTGEAVAIRSVIRQWNSLTWAQQGYYRAKFGFTEMGVLDITLTGESTLPDNSGFFLRGSSHDKIVTPQNAVHGSNGRLLTILEQGRVAVRPCRYVDEARLHIGPDETAILTTEVFWGLPRAADATGYTEPDDAYICYWENDPATWLPTAPWWAVCLDDLSYR